MAKPRLTLPVILRKGHEMLGLAGTVTLGIIALSCPFIAHGGGAWLKDIHYGNFLPPAWRWLWIDSQGLILGLLVLSGWMMHRRALKRVAEAAAARARAEVLAEIKRGTPPGPVPAPSSAGAPVPVLAKTSSNPALS